MARIKAFLNSSGIIFYTVIHLYIYMFLESYGFREKLSTFSFKQNSKDLTSLRIKSSALGVRISRFLPMKNCPNFTFPQSSKFNKICSILFLLHLIVEEWDFYCYIYQSQGISPPIYNLKKPAVVQKPKSVIFRKLFAGLFNQQF